MSSGWHEIGTKPLSPYFQALAKQPRMCPDCLKHKLRLVSLELTWDAAVWKCDGCGWFQTILAPESAKLGQREPYNVIKVDFGKDGSYGAKTER